MAALRLQAEGQVLTILNQQIIASGDANIDRCLFSFDEEWEGYVKTGVFYQDKANTQYVVLESDDTCMIPAAAMAREGNLSIGVFGINGSKVITSTVGKIYISEGAISGEEISTEPSDDVFLSIIAQYQRIAELIRQYEETMRQQNEILDALNAFDVMEIKQRLDTIEERMVHYSELAQLLIDRDVIIRDVPIKFAEGVCEIHDELILESSLCDVYFDEYSYEFAAKALILVSSYDGYIRITASAEIDEELTANILIRRC